MQGNPLLGKYLYFMDDDDLMASNFFDVLYAKIQHKEPDFISFNSVVVDNGVVQKKQSVRHRLTEDRYYDDIDLYLKDDYWNLSPVWIYLYKKSFLVDNDITFEKGISGEDNIFYVDVIRYANNAYILTDNLYYYVKRNGSVTTGTDSSANLRRSFNIVTQKIMDRSRIHSTTERNRFIKHRLKVSRAAEIIYTDVSQLRKVLIAVWKGVLFERTFIAYIIKSWRRIT